MKEIINDGDVFDDMVGPVMNNFYTCWDQISFLYHLESSGTLPRKNLPQSQAHRWRLLPCLTISCMTGIGTKQHIIFKSVKRRNRYKAREMQNSQFTWFKWVLNFYLHLLVYFHYLQQFNRKIPLLFYSMLHNYFPLFHQLKTK